MPSVSTRPRPVNSYSRLDLSGPRLSHKPGDFRTGRPRPEVSSPAVSPPRPVSQFLPCPFRALKAEALVAATMGTLARQKQFAIQNLTADQQREYEEVCRTVRDCQTWARNSIAEILEGSGGSGKSQLRPAALRALIVDAHLTAIRHCTIAKQERFADENLSNAKHRRAFLEVCERVQACQFSARFAIDVILDF